MSNQDSYAGLSPGESQDKDEVKKRASDFRKKYGQPESGLPEKGAEEGDLANYALFLPGTQMLRAGEAAEQVPSVARSLIGRMIEGGAPKAAEEGAAVISYGKAAPGEVRELQSQLENLTKSEDWSGAKKILQKLRNLRENNVRYTPPEK